MAFRFVIAQIERARPTFDRCVIRGAQFSVRLLNLLKQRRAVEGIANPIGSGDEQVERRASR